ncbi:TPA: hypothetical protein ENS27_08730 [bacterium]|nr:hypothetical protein [bacterium]
MLNKINNIIINNPSQANKNTKQDNTINFADVLANKQSEMEVKFSGHAKERLRQQNITISATDLDKINDATKMAEKKGSKESLMLLRDLALVVNISNKTVITAVDKERQKDKIFTNIDSTIIL